MKLPGSKKQRRLAILAVLGVILTLIAHPAYHLIRTALRNPQAAGFFAAKKAFDPPELFQNQFYLQYGNRP